MRILCKPQRSIRNIVDPTRSQAFVGWDEVHMVPFFFTCHEDEGIQSKGLTSNGMIAGKASPIVFLTNVI